MTTHKESPDDDDGGFGAGRDFSDNGGGAEGNCGGGAEGSGGVFCRWTAGASFSKLGREGLGGGVVSVTLACISSRSRLMEVLGVNSSSGKKSKLDRACCKWKTNTHNDQKRKIGIHMTVTGLQGISNAKGYIKQDGQMASLKAKHIQSTPTSTCY